jgi:hypothetical protein
MENVSALLKELDGKLSRIKVSMPATVARRTSQTSFIDVIITREASLSP